MNIRLKGASLAGRARDLLRCRKGTSAVEFGLIAAPFLALILVALQIFIMFFAEQVLETAAETMGRRVLTGALQKQALTQAQFQSAVCAAIPTLLKCSGIMIDVQTAPSFAGATTTKPTLTYDASGKVTNAWQMQLGNPGDIVVFRVMYQWPMFNLFGFAPANLPNGTRLLMATSVFKNEYYQ